jgi:AAA domain
MPLPGRARRSVVTAPAWHGQIVIIWINGTFGVGKTTAARLLSQQDRRLRLFDPEWVGYMLRENLSDYPVTDFRHWESWRVLTPLVADELIRFSGQNLVAPQTVLEENYWDELMSALSERDHEVFHVLLEAEDETLRARIGADEVDAAALPWRLDHISKVAHARPWLTGRADLVVDTTHLTAGDVAGRIWEVAAQQIT